MKRKQLDLTPEDESTCKISEEQEEARLHWVQLSKGGTGAEGQRRSRACSAQPF